MVYTCKQTTRATSYSREQTALAAACAKFSAVKAALQTSLARTAQIIKLECARAYTHSYLKIMKNGANGILVRR